MLDMRKISGPYEIQRYIFSIGQLMSMKIFLSVLRNLGLDPYFFKLLSWPPKFHEVAFI